MHNYHNKVLERVNECHLIAEQALKYYRDVCTIDYKITGVIAGKAYYFKNHISLNAILLDENEEVFIYRTVAHEIAHLVTKKVFKNAKPHGKEWKYIMRLFNAPTNRCHSYDVSIVSTRKKRKFIYSCDCKKPHIISVTKHNRALKGHKYECLECHQFIKFEVEFKL